MPSARNATAARRRYGERESPVRLGITMQMGVVEGDGVASAASRASIESSTWSQSSDTSPSGIVGGQHDGFARPSSFSDASWIFSRTHGVCSAGGLYASTVADCSIPVGTSGGARWPLVSVGSRRSIGWSCAAAYIFVCDGVKRRRMMSAAKAAAEAAAAGSVPGSVAS